MADILLVEDDKTMAFLLESSLTHCGHNVVLTESASDAFALFAEQRFDLVVTDLIVFQYGGISTRSGTMLISRIRGLENPDDGPGRAAKTPILAISGTINTTGQEHMLAMASQVGADRVLAKPFGVDEFVEAVSGLLNSDPVK